MSRAWRCSSGIRTGSRARRAWSCRAKRWTATRTSRPTRAARPRRTRHEALPPAPSCLRDALGGRGVLESGAFTARELSMSACLRAAAAPAAFVALLAGLDAGAMPVSAGAGIVPLPGTTEALEPWLAGTQIDSMVMHWVSADDPLYGFPGA